MQALDFFTENESLLSALAALAVIVGFFATAGKNFIARMSKPTKPGSLSERLTLSELSAPRGDRIDDCASQFIEEHNLPEELQAQLEQAIRFRMVWANV